MWVASRPYVWTWEVTELTCRGRIFHSLQLLDNRGIVRFLTRAAYLPVSTVSRTVWFPPILLLSGCSELFAWSWCVQGVKLAIHFHAILMLRKELYLHSPICLYVVVLNWSIRQFNLLCLLIIGDYFVLWCTNYIIKRFSSSSFWSFTFPGHWWRRKFTERGDITSQYSVTFAVMVMRTSNVKLVILTGKIMSCNMVQYKMYRAHIHSRCSRVIGEKAWQASTLLW